MSSFDSVSGSRRPSSGVRDSSPFVTRRLAPGGSPGHHRSHSGDAPWVHCRRASRTSAYKGAAMPWFPDFVGAIELARQQTRSRGQADPVAEYFGALQSGARPRPGNGVAGRRGDLRPAPGEVRGHHQLRKFVRENQSRLARLHATIETVASTLVGDRAVVELLAHLADSEGRTWHGRSPWSPSRRTSLGAVPHLLQPMAGRRETASATAHTQERGGPSR